MSSTFQFPAPVTSAGKTSDKSAVRRILELPGLEYGPAPEDTKVVNAWLDDHGRSFGHFINNKWHKPEGRSFYETKNPATGEILCKTIQGNQDDANFAVESARQAFGSWSQLSPHARARHLYSIARHLQKHMRIVACIESMDNGKPVRESRDADIPGVVRHIYHHAGWAQLMDSEMREWAPLVSSFAARLFNVAAQLLTVFVQGVVCAIVPWNFPLMLLAWKVCPALAMGNTVVLKPATYTRLSALVFAEICAEAGLPPGVFNVVTGNGQFGESIALHPDVDKVGFTGSTGIGRVLKRAIAGSGKKISLELGGKSPVVVLEGADLDAVVEGVVDAIWFNQGQVCSAGSRLLVQEGIAVRLIEKIKYRMQRIRVGDSMDKCIDMGAVVDESQWKTVDGYVQAARDEGAQVFQYCACMPSGGKGLYYPPTLITNVQSVSTVIQEEIFGPVLAVMTFRTVKEAILLANNTVFGLGASVWTQDINSALELAFQIRAGTVWINGHNMFDAAAGFGGFKESGYGRDGGKEGLYEYVKPKWQARARPSVAAKLDTSFGAYTWERPGCASPNVYDVKDPSSQLPAIDHTHKVYIGGTQKRPDAPYARKVLCHDGRVLANVPDCNRKDVRDAVEAAHAAAPGWGKRAAHNRAQIVYYVAENLEMRFPEFVDILQKMTGGKREECEKEVSLSIQRLFHWGAYADKFGGTVQETVFYGATVKIHEPVGVVAIACPDEYPLLAFVSLWAPAVVRGNTVIVIPSQKWPLPALELYQVYTAATP